MQCFDTDIHKLGYIVFGFVIILFLFLSFSGSYASASSAHIVISEIQVGEVGHAENEFIELYNPTDNDTDLTGWKLATGTQNLISLMSGTLKSHGFFLIAKPQFLTISITPDATYTATASAITSNSVVILQKKESGVYTTVDKVGMGTSADFEGSVVAPPIPGTSIERKANSLSTPDSMAAGGVDEFLGNGEDSDNNLSDFVVRAFPQPQNSFSDIEPVAATPTATPTPTESPSPTPSPTLEPTPTASPTETPTPSLIPTPRGWSVSPVFTCTNIHIPSEVYSFLKYLMPRKFSCG